MAKALLIILSVFFVLSFVLSSGAMATKFTRYCMWNGGFAVINYNDALNRFYNDGVEIIDYVGITNSRNWLDAVGGKFVDWSTQSTFDVIGASDPIITTVARITNFVKNLWTSLGEKWQNLGNS